MSETIWSPLRRSEIPYKVYDYYGIMVEQSVIKTHEEALEAWRQGMLPTVDPPATPPLLFYGSEA